MSAVIVVTGAFGALGRAVVERLRTGGDRVVAIDAAPDAGVEADLVLAGIDLADVAAVERAYATVADRLGSVDGVANIAGGFVWELILGGEAARWEAMFRTNLLSAALSSRAALPYLVKQGGAIVNVGAAATGNAAAGMGPYAASKAGVTALTQSLADEMKGKGVRVNAVLPTILDTPTNRRDMPDADISQWIKPADAADVIAFLLSDQAKCVTGAGIALAAN